MNVTRLLVVGGGAAGMAVATAAWESGLTDIWLAERNATLGGVLPQCVHSGFGLARFGRDMTGAAYAEAERQRLARTDVRVLTRTAVLELRPDQTALLCGPAGLMRVGFSRCVLAAGCRETPAGALDVAGTRPAGVFTAGEVQRMLAQSREDMGNRIVILGSGDVGQIVARELTLRGKQIVAMVEKRDSLGGLPRNRRECVEACRVPVAYRATVEEIHGRERITGVTLRHLDSGARERLACDALITAVGLIPDQTLAAPLTGADGSVPGWLHLCGNCDTVHEIVDKVTDEGERLGRRLAREAAL